MGFVIAFSFFLMSLTLLNFFFIDSLGLLHHILQSHPSPTPYPGDVTCKGKLTKDNKIKIIIKKKNNKIN